MGDYTRPFFGGSARSKRKVLLSHMDSQGLNQSTFVGILPLWYRNFWRSTLFQRGQLWNFTLAFVVVEFRDAVSIYSTVEVHIEQVEKLKTSCQHFFNATCLLLNVVTSTVRTIAISYHTSTHYPLHTSYATLRGWSGPTLSTPAVIQNFVGAPFSYWSQNPFVSPLLGKFPYFFSLTSKYWRYSCHTNSFITAD